MNNKPQKGQYLEILLRSPQSIFTSNDVAILWGEKVKKAFWVRLGSYVKKGKLIRLRRGIYAKDNNFNRFELATRIYTPDYISFETVLTQEGVNFQFYDTIFVASYLTREMNVAGQKIAYIRMKADILTNPSGIEYPHQIPTASKERAFLDRLYVSKEYHFDHLKALDQEKVFEILPIYRNKRLEKKVKNLFSSS